MTSLEGTTRKRLQEKKVLFSLRELEERTGVSNVVLHNFLKGKSLHPSSLRKILAWLDGGPPPAVEVMDKLLAELLPEVDTDTYEDVRRSVWRIIARGLRDSEHPVPDWLKLQTTGTLTQQKRGIKRQQDR